MEMPTVPRNIMRKNIKKYIYIKKIVNSYKIKTNEYINKYNRMKS